MTHQLFSIAKVRAIPFPLFANETGELSVYEGNSDVPFEIARAYSIRAPKNVTRGNHAITNAHRLSYVFKELVRSSAKTA